MALREDIMSSVNRQSITGARPTFVGNPDDFSYNRDISKATNILSLNNSARANWLASFDYVFTEFEGVLWKFNSALPNAGAVINRLMKIGKNVKLITGGSLRDDAEYIELFKSIGVVEFKASDIVHPVKALIRYITQIKLSGTIFSLATRKVNEQIAKTGLNILSMEPNVGITLDNIVGKVHTENKVCAVIMDFNINLSYCQMAKAHQYLRQKECAFIVGSYNTYLQAMANINTLGNAGFVDVLREASGKTPVIVGKPGAQALIDLKNIFKINNPERVLFIGSSLYNDIQFGLRCGFKTLMVLTGMSTKDDITIMPLYLQPDYVLNQIGELIEVFDSPKM